VSYKTTFIQMDNLRPMMATTVIGKGYVSGVVVYMTHGRGISRER
jgi:hypothetical protein